VNWGEAYFERFVKLFGNPINQAVWEKEGFIAIQILTFAPASDLLIFGSIGLTLYPVELGGTYEVFLPAGDWAREVPHILGRALTVMVENSQKLGAGVSFNGIEKIFPDFSAKTGKTALYFTGLNGLENLAAVSLSEEEKGQLLMAFFISAEENKFLAENGAEKFAAALNRAEIGPADINRKSIF